MTTDQAPYRIGHLYSCRHGAFSAVVATDSASDARAVFHSWIVRTHGVNVNPQSIHWPRSTRSIGDRPLLIVREP